MEIVNIIAQRLNINEQQVQRTIKLLNEGATIPFISRYRKEVTGGLNEVEVAAVKDENDRLSEMQHRKNTILLTIDEQGKLTDFASVSRIVGIQLFLKTFICLINLSDIHEQKKLDNAVWNL